MAKASDENGSDGEERKLGEQTGLDIENRKFSELIKNHQVCKILLLMIREEFLSMLIFD